MIYKTLHRKLKIEEWNQMIWKGKQLLLHMLHQSCYSCYKPGDKSWMSKGPHCDYDKWNISVVICDTDIP